MQESKQFFKEPQTHFFRPLVGKYREKARACIQALYLRLNGPMADCSYHLSRQDVIDIFLQALTLAPELDSEGFAEDGLSSDDKLAPALLNALKRDGWIEDYHDDVAMRTAFRFTPVGRVFAKSFVDIGRDRIRANHRNTRNTRSALYLYLEKRDPYDLVEADRFAQEVFNDFNESIEEIELMQQQQAQQITDELELEQASEEFFEYLEKRFIPDVSKMMADDSVKKYQAEIKDSLEAIRALPDEDKARMEMDLRREFPLFLNYADASILIWLLEQIERRIDNACDIKLPELRKVLEGFTRRSQLVIRQLAHIYASEQQDIDMICRRLANLPREEADSILSNAGDHVPLARVALVNPDEIRPHGKRVRERVKTTVVERRAPSEEERLQASVRRALDMAFSVEDSRIVDAVVSQLADSDQIRSRYLSIDSVEDLFTAMHIASLGSNNHELNVKFIVEETGELVHTPYYSGKDYRIRIEPK